MPNTPLVTVVMCTYNGEKYLEEQLDSIINQSYSAIEIIVVDDCSTDNTIQILSSYEQKRQLKYFKNEFNIGVNQNFEKGISLANGDLIALSDQDDIWDKSKIQVLVDKIQNNVLVYCDSELVDSKGNSINKHFSDVARFINGQDPLPFLFNNCCSGHAILFRKELAKTALPIKLVNGSGVYFDQWLGFAAGCVGSIDYVNTALVKYRQHDQSVTDLSGLKKRTISRKERKIMDVENMLKRFLSLAQLESIPAHDKVVIDELIMLYQTKLTTFFSVPLFVFLLKYRHRLFKISLKSDWKVIRNCYKLSFGV